MFVKVETYAGERGDRTPCRLHLDGRVVEIERVLNQWQGNDYHYVKLRGEDGNLCILRLDETGAEWELILFQSPRGETMPVQPAPRKKRPNTPGSGGEPLPGPAELVNPVPDGPHSIDTITGTIHAVSPAAGAITQAPRTMRIR